MNIDERLEALTMSLELMLRETEAHSKQIEAHSKQLVQDAENIRALARIAELH
jgi:16S rRNA G527 N7-methylase RsmG